MKKYIKTKNTCTIKNEELTFLCDMNIKNLTERYLK